MGQRWRQLPACAVGGLTDVGFSPDDRYLLVVGHQGRGVFDCISAERVARSPEPDGFYPEETTGRADGIGPLDGQQVPMAGLMSDHALPESHAPWRVEVTSTTVTLTDGKELYKYPNTEEVRACGFGHHGRTVVLATSGDVTLFVLDDDRV